MIRINLLPRPPRRPVGRGILEIGIPAAVAVILVVWTVLLGARAGRLEAEIAQTNARINELQPQVTRVLELRRQIEAAQKKEDLLAQLLASQLPASSILTNIRALIPKEAWLTAVTVPDRGSLQLDGFAMSYVVLARLMDNLSTSALFQGVDLGVAERDRIAGKSVVKFQVTARITRPSPQAQGGAR